jgi:hypothetical protein
MLPINPDVISVQPLPEYRLLLKFSNGERKIFDATPYLSVGIFTGLKDPKAFAAAYVEYGSVEWPIGAGLSYNTLYMRGTPVDPLASKTVA